MYEVATYALAITSPCLLVILFICNGDRKKWKRNWVDLDDRFDRARDSHRDEIREIDRRYNDILKGRNKQHEDEEKKGNYILDSSD